MPLASNVPRNFVDVGQVFNVHLVMDLTEVNRPPGASLGYKVTGCAKKLGKSHNLWRREKCGAAVGLDRRIPCSVEATLMLSKTYRLWVETVLV
jgi:hypothetical protein